MRHRAFEILARIEDVPSPVGAEIGVAEGDTASVLLARPDLVLIMVDNWQAAEHQPEHYRATGDRRSNMSAPAQAMAKAAALVRTEFAADRRIVMHAPSVEASERVRDGSLDFVFIDADHSYEGCLADLEAWAPKVKPGGLVAGHDYTWIPSVRAAVDEWAGSRGLPVTEGQDSTWFVHLENVTQEVGA